jgi:transposase
MCLLFNVLFTTGHLNRISLYAKKTNAHCRALFDRLVGKGKNKKAAVIAVCNKLLKIVFGVVKNRASYQNNYIQKTA